MPDGETLLALADYFDVSVESLMRDDMPLEHIGDVYSQEDPAIFYDVQKRLKSQRSAPGKAKSRVDYLLSMKLFCGHCGSLMTGECGI